MRAVVQRGFGGSDALRHDRVAEPVLAPGEVLVRIAACAVNHLDILQRRGPPRIPGFALPHIPGMDIAGTVVAAAGAHPAGSAVVVNPSAPCRDCAACRRGEDNHCPRLRIIGASTDGGYAEYVAVPAGNVYRVPGSVPLPEAAALPSTLVTGWHALMTVGGLRAGETVLVHGAAGGVGLAAVQLATQAGARVLAVASTRAKLDLAAELGADTLLPAGPDVVRAVRSATGGHGVDLAFDTAGSATWSASLYALAPRGRLVFLGSTAGDEVRVPLGYCYGLGLRLLGGDGYTAAEFGAVLDRYLAGGLRVPIDGEYPLADVAAAHDRLERRLARGKVVIRPTSR